jgi:hypothetical protein
VTDKQGHHISRDVERKVKDVQKPGIVVHEPVDSETEDESISLKVDIIDNRAVANFAIKVNNELFKSLRPEEAKFTVDESIPLKPG